MFLSHIFTIWNFPAGYFAHNTQQREREREREKKKCYQMLSCVITIWQVQVCYFSISFFFGGAITPPAARHQASGRPQCNPLRSRCLRSPWPCPWTPGAGSGWFLSEKRRKKTYKTEGLWRFHWDLWSLCGLMGFNCQSGILRDYCKPSINGVLWDLTIQYVDVWGLSL